jgi:dTDP-4-dehydrorhamnose reductase
MPLLRYGTESCPVTKADVQLFDFTVMRFLMKVFKSTNCDLIINCIGFFNFSLPNDVTERRQANFSVKFDKLPNLIHRLY